ncbi:TlpA family protein disulfide reductase [Pedobacter africanus]|uniref:Thiol-disulfide isomerase/thioredoxin n=1 Tax=Pedobacter africanus TaxID=151894 RepID=A0ACC6KRG9_9SPHI|nr:TlpA disulfide reductase family protein [Pedobacter africanus]MDR6781948.1 thiol-disulfide isomerase/thioredoxin [Pedobacter africanus]
MEKNPGALLSVYYLYTVQALMKTEELKARFEKLDNTHKKSFYGQVIANRLAGLEATAIGKSAVALRKKDMNGNDVSLETLKGKYVILDFWGSWCHPCRLSHPHLKELYAKYKADGFEIVGIAEEPGQSLEKGRKAWLNAVKEDGIDWIQVLNNEGIEHFDAVKAYGISAFPTKILLDREGKIIGRYIGNNKDIDAKLTEVFGK